MTNVTYILSSLKSRFLGSSLTIMLTAFGVAMALTILLFTHHVETRLTKDSKNIDLVIGAKGSPLQIILSTVYHIDIPTGNIPWDDAQKWMKHSQVKQAIPLALGDNWHGYRIVGTTPDYMKLYNATLRDGEIWDHAFEAVIGSDIDMAIGDTFLGAHGLVQGGHVHEDEKYKVIGRLNKTGTVMDRLILTSLDSVLEIHGLEGVEHEHEGHDHDGLEGHEDHDEHDDGDEETHHHHHHSESGEPEITALLIQTKNPMANMNLPHIINQDGLLQAANPALEMARLTSMLGVGTQTLSFVSILLMVIACFSIFTGIAATLDNRKTDLAVLRALGYSRGRIFTLIAGEGLMLVVMGSVIGGVMSMIGFALLKHTMPSLSASGASYHLIAPMIYIYGGALLAGLIAAMIPAYRATKIDVAKQLA